MKRVHAYQGASYCKQDLFGSKEKIYAERSCKKYQETTGDKKKKRTWTNLSKSYEDR